MSENSILQVEHVSKKFCGHFRKSLWYGIQDVGRELLLSNRYGAELREGEFWALNDISFKLAGGEALGIIGNNGAGKTTLLRLLSGLMKPDCGRIIVRGRTAALIELGAGFDPVLTGRENIYINGALLGMTRKDMTRVLNDIIDFADLGEFIDTPLQNYSAGMRVRLGYSVAAHIYPELLIIDEVLAVGDIGFQRKCLQHAIQYLRSGGSLVLVSHNMHLVQSICQRSVFLDHGEIRHAGTSSEAIDVYLRSQNCTAADDFEGTRSSNGDDATPLIEKINITPLEGTAITSGQGMRLTLYYDSPQNLPSVTWGFSFWTKDLQIRIATCLAKYTNQKHSLSTGKGHFSCVVPKVPLAPGVYAVRAGIYDMETAWPITRIGWDNAPTFFTIEGSLDEQSLRRSVDGDIISVEVDWND